MALTYLVAALKLKKSESSDFSKENLYILLWVRCLKNILQHYVALTTF